MAAGAVAALKRRNRQPPHSLLQRMSTLAGFLRIRGAMFRHRPVFISAPRHIATSPIAAEAAMAKLSSTE